MIRYARSLLIFVGMVVGAASGAAAVNASAVPDDASKVQPLQPGARARGFEVRTATNEPFHFDPRALAKPAVIIFYRGGWCPYCNAHLGQLRTAEPELIAMGYDVLFLSADRPELLKPSLKEPDINYTLLSDGNMNAARAFGVAFRLDDATVQQYKKFNVDLEAASGATHHQLPVPAVFIIDRAGTIQFAHWNPDYKVRLSGDEILAAARKAQASKR